MTDDARLDDLLDRWEAARDLGQSVDLSELCASCPELRPLAQEQIAALEQVDSLLFGTQAGDWTFGGGDLAGESLQQVAVPPSIGRYRLDQLLGEGGFGRVWRAFDPSLARPVAVKVLRGSRTRWPRQVEQFLEEARKLAKLRHPHIVPVYDVGRDGPHVYLVSAMVEGENLACRLARERLSVDAAVDLTATIADALHHAHQCGMVHRDIKPANILLDQTGQPFITDFGIAVSSAETPEGILGSAGTPRYIAPEQISAATVDPRSDVFSLGVILYEMLTGCVLRSSQPASPRTKNSAVPAEIALLSLAAIEHDPAKRPATAAQFADRLRAAMHNWRQTRPRRFLSRRGGLAVGLAAAVAFAVGWIPFLFPTIASREDEQAASTPGDTWRGGPNAKAILRGHRAGVCALALSPDGRQLLSGAWDGTARLWDIETGKQLAELPVEQPVVFAAAFSAGKSQALFGGKDCAIKVWDTAGKAPLGELVGHSEGEFILSVRCLSDGRRALSASGDWTVRLWNLQAMAEIRRFSTGAGWAWSLAVSPDETLVAVGAVGAVVVWNIESGDELRRFTGPVGAVDAVAFSRDGKQIVSGGEDQICCVWDLESGKQMNCFRGHIGRVRGIACLPDGQAVLSAGEDHTARLWGIANGREICRYADARTNLNTVVVMPGGAEFAAACNDGAIRIWSLPGAAD